MKPADSVRIAAFGRTGSGKTEYLWRHWLHKEPRLLVVDETGEWEDRAATHKDQYDFVSGLPATITALQRHAHERTWRIITDLHREELLELCARILPRGKIRKGYTANIGGMALLIEEADTVMPIGASPPTEIRAIFRRGRHGGLSVFASAQRANISKELTANCQYIALLSLHEPRDEEYFTDLFKDKAMAQRALQWVNDIDHPYRVAVFETTDRSLTFYDKDGVACGKVAQEKSELAEESEPRHEAGKTT
jgi:hypothetical protein